MHQRFRTFKGRANVTPPIVLGPWQLEPASNSIDCNQSMKHSVRVGAIFAVSVVALLAVTVIFRGPPKPFVSGLLLVVIFWWAVRTAITRYRPRKD
jgi:hypothetical protein